MSARRSEHSKMLKRFDDQVQRYTGQIANQKKIIDRLLAANVAYADGLDEVLNGVTNVKDARKVSRSAMEAAKAILAVEPDAGPANEKEIK